MIRRWAVVALAVTAVAAIGATAFAQDSMTTLEPRLEAWYQPDPTCTSPIGCVTTALPVAPPVEVPTSSPYPAGTLHVGWASSAETARSYLAFPVQSLGRITSATLTVPLDVDPANGDAQSSTAQVRACLATGDIREVEGSISEPPTVDCTLNAVLQYVATPTPQLRGDLEPLLVGLATTPGIALLPVASESPSAAWHVTFSSRLRTDEGKTPPASLRVTIEEGPTTTTSTSTIVGLGVEPPPAEDEEAASTVLDLPVDVDPTVAAVPTTIGASPATPAGPETATPAAVVTETVGYAYPGLWLLPLVLLVVVPLVARSLTKDLEPPS